MLTTSIYDSPEDPKPATKASARFDICPTWLELAGRHLSDAQAARFARIAAWGGTNETAKLGALDWEFEASLQAIVACGTSVEAFGAAVESKIQLPQSLRDEGSDNGVPHTGRVAEAILKAFSLDSQAAIGVRQCIGEILRFRDLGIDPSHKGDDLIFHPELGAGVEWRFAYFRYENALSIAQATLWLIWKLVASGNPNDGGVQEYVDALRPRIEALKHTGPFKAGAPAGKSPSQRRT